MNKPDLDKKTLPDRRLQERFFLDLEVRISRINNNACGGEAHCVAANISAGGAFLQTSADIPLASILTLQFLVDYEQLQKLRFVLSLESLRQYHGQKIWVTTTGIVIRREDDGISIIFADDYQLTPLEGENGTPSTSVSE